MVVNCQGPVGALIILQAISFHLRWSLKLVFVIYQVALMYGLDAEINAALRLANLYG